MMRYPSTTSKRCSLELPEQAGRKKYKITDVSAGVSGGVLEGRVISVQNHSDVIENPDDRFLRFTLSDGIGTIPVYAYGDLCKKFSESVEMNQCYRITAYKTERRDPARSAADHPCRVILIKISCVEQILEEEFTGIPCTIKQLHRYKIGKRVNLTAIVYNIQYRYTIYNIDSPKPTPANPRPWRYANLVDGALLKDTLQLMPDHRGILDDTEGTCVTLSNVEVGEHRGCIVLTYRDDSAVDKEPESEEARKLQEWFDEDGIGKQYSTLVPQHSGQLSP